MDIEIGYKNQDGDDEIVSIQNTGEFTQILYEDFSPVGLIYTDDIPYLIDALQRAYDEYKEAK